MNIEIWLLYFGALIAIMSTPGPSHILMLSNSLSNGFSKAKYTAFGDLTANVLQMIAATLGLVTVLHQSPQIFIYIKYAGVAYLVFLGVKLIFINTKKEIHLNSKRSKSSLYWQGFMTSAVNPKAIIFFTALFPQFIIPQEPLFPQFMVLSITFIAVDGAFLSFYGFFASYFAQKLKSSIGQYFNKISGFLYIATAILLGTKEFK